MLHIPKSKVLCVCACVHVHQWHSFGLNIRGASVEYWVMYACMHVYSCLLLCLYCMCIHQHLVVVHTFGEGIENRLPATSRVAPVFFFFFLSFSSKEVLHLPLCVCVLWAPVLKQWSASLD